MSQLKERTNGNGSKTERTKGQTLYISDLNREVPEAEDAEPQPDDPLPAMAPTRSFRMAKDDKTARLVIGLAGIVAVALVMLIVFSQKSKPKLRKSDEASLGRPKVAEAPSNSDSIVPGGSMQ